MISMGNSNCLLTEIHIDSASPVSVMKKELLHKLKIRETFLKIDEITEKSYQGFASTINIIEKVIMKIQSMGWEAKD